MSFASLNEPIHPIRETGIMDSTDSPRSEQPRRWIITPAQKSVYPDGYEKAIETGEGGGYLRTNGIYSSQITEWRRLRDAGILDGTVSRQATSSSSKQSKEQAEISRLKKQLADREQKLTTTQTALDIMGYAENRIMPMFA